jgi:hypothetical protein
VLTIEPAKQPKLPQLRLPNEDGRLVRVAWPAPTRAWWKLWGDSPLSDEFGETDWAFLLDTALLHARFWRGDARVAGELRLREAKFGATPEDRLRLRMTFELADEAAAKGDQRRARSGSDSQVIDAKSTEAPADPRMILQSVPFEDFSDR